jgi:ribosomal protein L21E
MVRRKAVRTRGKLQLSKYFQEFDNGDNVAVIKERSVASSFPTRLQGRTGKVAAKRGKSYLVNIKDQNKPKSFLISPIHLKKIGQANDKE